MNEIWRETGLSWLRFHHPKCIAREPWVRYFFSTPPFPLNKPPITMEAPKLHGRFVWYGLMSPGLAGSNGSEQEGSVG